MFFAEQGASLRSATLGAAPRRSAPLRSAPLAQAVRAAEARRQVEADLDAAEASGERDQAAKRARSASAVAAAAASSSLSSVRETSIGASSESQKLRIRRFQRDIGRPLIKSDQPIDQRQDSTLAAVLGEPPTLQFSLQLSELLFEHADSAANATIFFDALSLMVKEFRVEMCNPTRDNCPVLARLFEEIVLLFAKYATNSTAVATSALYAIMVLVNDCKNDEEPGPAKNTEFFSVPAFESTRNLVYFGLGPLIVRVLDNACYAANSNIQFAGWEFLGGLMVFAVPRFYKTLADAGLCRIIANSIQRLVGDGVAYESDEDFHLATVCVVVKMSAFMYWVEFNAAGVPTAIRNAIDSAIDPQANTPEEEKFEECLMFDRDGEDALVALADAEFGVNGARASPSGGPWSEWLLNAKNHYLGEDDGRPKYGKKRRKGERGVQRAGPYVR